MVYVFVVVLMVLGGSALGAEEPEPAARASSDDLRVEDLPKPVTDLLEKLQQLSRKIEPEITKMGSRLGHELDETVKKLREELKSQTREPGKASRPDGQP